MKTLNCDVCYEKITDFDSDLFHYSGTIRGRVSGHIHLCSKCKAKLGLPLFDFDAAMEKVKGGVTK